MKNERTRKQRILLWGALALAAVILAGLLYWVFGPGFPLLSKTEIAQIEAHWDDSEKDSYGSKDFATIKVFFVQPGEEENTLLVYAWVNIRGYYKSGNSLVQDTGLSGIGTIHAVRQEDGTLKVKKVVFPRDGEERYPEDIRALPFQVQMKYNWMSTNQDARRELFGPTDDKARAYFQIDNITK